MHIISQLFTPTAHPQSCARLISIKGCLGRDSSHFNSSAKCRQPSPDQLPSSAACQQHGPGSSPPKAMHQWHRDSSCLYTTCKAASPPMGTCKAWVFNSRITAHLLYPVGGRATSLPPLFCSSQPWDQEQGQSSPFPTAALSSSSALTGLLQQATGMQHPSHEGRSEQLQLKS